VGSAAESVGELAKFHQGSAATVEAENYAIVADIEYDYDGAPTRSTK
jgi:hypothetical protein